MNGSLRQRMFWEDDHRLGEIILLVVLYLVTAFGGIQLASLNNFVTPVWPAAGISVFAVYRLGFSGAILTFLCVLLLDLVTGANLPVALAIAAGNTSEALTITILFHRWSLRPKDQKNAFQEFIARNFITALGCLISAIIGTLALYLGNTVTLSDLPRNTLTWFTGNYLGILLVFPLLTSLWSIPWHQFPNTLRKSLSPPRITLNQLASLTTLLAPPTLYLVMAPQYYGDSAIILGLLLMPLLARRTPAVFLWLSLLALASVVIGSAILEDLHHAEIDRNSRLLLIQVRIFACFLWYSIIGLLQREDMLRQSRWPLVIGWGLAAIIMSLTESYQRYQDRESVRRMSHETLLDINNLLNSYTNALRAGEALFRSSTAVSPEEWREFVLTLDVSKNYPALANLGVVIPVGVEDRSRHEEKLKNLYGQDLSIRPVPEYPLSADTSYVISYIEPLGRNAPALGLDLASEPRRRLAADRAVRSGSLTMTASIQLVQDRRQRPGFLIYHPVTRHGVLQYWTYAPVIAEDFFVAALSRRLPMEMIVTDPEFSQAPPLFSNLTQHEHQHEIFAYQTEFTLANRTLYFKFRPTPAFKHAQEAVTPFLLLGLTLLVLFLSTYISMIEVIRQRAQNLANTMSAALDAERARSQHAAKMHALGEMATGVAHEINNPLAIISGMTDHIKRQLRKDPTATDQIRQSVDRIQETAFRIARIVKGMQSFSHHAEGESPASLSLRQLVGETIDFARVRLEAADITITTVIDKDGPFLGKSIQLSQVLLNLINNAIDATDGQPNRWIHVMARIVDNHAVIAVTDSGPRIPKLIADKMMQPFFTTKAPGKGTGLGLNISQGIMASMEGRLYYDAQAAQTRFVMEFPLQQDAARVSTSA